MALHDFHFSSYNNNNNNNNDINSTNVSSSTTTLVLTNGMYSHVIDALAKSPNLNHIVMADILLRQFILLYINRVGRRKGVTAAAAAAGVNHLDDASSQQDILPSEVRPMLSLECPNGQCWNDKDRHHYPNMILITGVIRGYARSLRPIDAERLLNLMISLSTSSLAPSPSSSSSSFSSMFRPNDVSYATVIDAYSRIHDGPNAERVLEMMKYRNDDNKVVDDDEDDNTRRINHANK